MIHRDGSPDSIVRTTGVLNRRRPVAFLMAFVVSSVIAWIGLGGVIHHVVVDVDAVQPVDGKSFAFALPPAPRLLERRSDLETEPARSTLQVFENERPLGPGHSQHATIAAKGGGRYSHWHDFVYFSTADGTDPRANGRKYSVSYRLFLPLGFGYAALVVVVTLGFVASTKLLRWCYLRCPPRIARMLVDTLQSFAIVLVTLVSLIGIGELWLRVKRPFLVPEWPIVSEQGVGAHQKPNATVRWTNQLDYWIEERANSLGFLDREPGPRLRDPAYCNVTMLGDSFVEAAQVFNRQKFHVLFERLAQEHMPERKIVTQAFGYSGTGQLNQFPFYERYARPSGARVIVLVFVSNDFANNSSVLEGVRNGWHPLRSPRLFAQRDQVTGQIRLLPTSDTNGDALLDPPAISGSARFIQTASRKSYLFAWLLVNLRLHHAKLAAIIDPTADPTPRYVAAMRKIAEIPGFEAAFDGWDYPGDLAMDEMFNVRSTLPPAFEDAWAYTAFAIDNFKAAAERDSATVVALLTNSLSPDARTGAPITEREYAGDFARNRLSALLESRGIPYIDQRVHSDTKGVEPDKLHFAHDGHWSVAGHRYAAEALLALFLRNPSLCSKD